MFSFIVIIFEAVAVLFIGIFARTLTFETDFISRTNFLSSAMILMLAFALMYSPFRKLSLFAMVILLLSLALSAQTNILFGTFWDSCFNGFSSNFTINVTLLVRSIFASLAVLLTCLDFAGLFDYWQVYILIGPIMTIGYSLCSSVLTYGLKVYDGGGGLIIFLYSGVCSLMIWMVSIRGKTDISKFKIKQSYINHTLSFIGVVIAFISWPSFNAGGAFVSMINTPFATTDYYLQKSALINTFLGLATVILTSVVLASKDTKTQKLKTRLYVDCFINAGIVIASYEDLCQNPVAGMVMVVVSTLLTLIINKYLLTSSESEAEVNFKFLMINYSKIFYRILFSFLGIITCSIVVATRSNATPTLISDGNYSLRAGLEIVAFLVVAAIAVVFGLITAASINCFISYKRRNLLESNEGDRQVSVEKKSDAIDDHFFDGLLEEIHPIYYDIFDPPAEKEEINVQNYTTKVIKESLLRSADNPLRMGPSAVKQHPKQDNTQSKFVIRKDFSKRNVDSGVNVSQMKIIEKNPRMEESEKSDRESQKFNEEPIHVNKTMTVQRSTVKINMDQNLPKQAKEVNRKLNFDQYGSQIEEEIPHTKEIKK